MDTATIAMVIKIIEVLMELASEAPEIVSAAEDALASLRTGEPMTPAQLASIDALLERTHKALQTPMPDEAPPVAEAQK